MGVHDAPATDPREVAALAAARSRILETIAAACVRAGRAPEAVTLVAVSKTVDAARLRAAVAAGLTLLGENRVQEAAAKAPEVPGATWELVGPLQSNKARRAVETVARIESVDSVELALRLDRLVREVRGLAAEGAVGAADRYPVLLQVNVDADPAKAGFEVGEIAGALAEIAARCGALRLDGLMTIGRLVESEADARATFRGLRELSERLRAGASGGGTTSGVSPLGPALSMGMSDDYALAVEEGATIVRVGRALFGARPAPGDGAAGGPSPA